MKKMILLTVAMLTMTLSANAMSYEQARREALFLTDKMAYELNLSDAQYEAAYEINLDYLMSVTSYDNVFGPFWERRNLDLSYILYSWQWEAFRAASYFYRPLYWEAGFWHFGIYRYYPHRDFFYFGRPHFYATYRGGHSWRMNGGHSFYHGRADHFRPEVGNHHQHAGMRDSYDRGHFSGPRAGNNSSTRVTAGRDGMDHNRRGGFEGDRRGGIDNNRNGSSGTFSGNRDNGVRNGNSGSFNSNSPRNGSSSGSFSNSRIERNTVKEIGGGSTSRSTVSPSNSGTIRNNIGTVQRSSGSSSGVQRSSGSFSSSPRTGSSTPQRSSGSFGNSGSSRNSGSFSGSSSTRSSGSSSGGSRGGGSSRSSSHGSFSGGRR